MKRLDFPCTLCVCVIQLPHSCCVRFSKLSKGSAWSLTLKKVSKSHPCFAFASFRATPLPFISITFTFIAPWIANGAVNWARLHVTSTKCWLSSPWVDAWLPFVSEWFGVAFLPETATSVACQAQETMRAGEDEVLSYTFPCALSARQRAWIHEAAERRGWHHASAGGEDPTEPRRITVTRPAPVCTPVSPPARSLSHPPPPFESEVDDITVMRWAKAGLDMDLEPYQPPLHVRTKHPEKDNAHRPVQVDLEAFILQQEEMVEMERMAEEEEAMEAHQRRGSERSQATGKAMGKLQCTSVERGLLGKVLLVLGRKDGKPLPEHQMTPHDEAAVRRDQDNGDAILTKGVVYRVGDKRITLAIEDVPEEGFEDGSSLRIEKLANQVTYNRLLQNLHQLGRCAQSGADEGKGRDTCPGRKLVPILFGQRDPQHEKEIVSWKANNLKLDESQKEAIGAALRARELFLIHGPPGTGKTTTVVEYIFQEVKRGKRVLAAAASNIAVDNMVERLTGTSKKLKVLRIGHPARLLPSVLDTCLEARVLASDSSALAKDCRSEMKTLTLQLLKLKRFQRAEKKEIREELKRLRKEERQRQTAAIVEVMRRSNVVCSTLTNCPSHHLRNEVFDVVVIDEAAQALEVACWGGILKAAKVVLAGDHLQLPPTILSKRAEEKGFGTTLFERLHTLYGQSCSSMLNVQYRMNSKIMEWSSQAMYCGQLQAHPSVADHTLGQLVQARSSGKDTAFPILQAIDTAGCDMLESCEQDHDSKYNEDEAGLVQIIVQDLLHRGLIPSDIGVITPYRAQVSLLRNLRATKWEGVEISTVDGFQGREKEAIVISLVRSNENGEVGFLSDKRRMNVAITRARRHCTIVGDSDTASNDPFLAALFRYFEEYGEVRSAEEVVNFGL